MDNSLPEIISINQLCSLMSISRSRYYQILSEGLILPPILSDSKRPYFTRELALKNLAVKKNNNNKKENKKKTTNKYIDIIDGLSSLGIDEVSKSQIEDALKKCFPDGTNNVDEGEILRQVFCLISKQNTTDNQDR